MTPNFNEYSSQDEVQKYLRENCPKFCPSCGDKVKKYKVDGSVDGEKVVMCKNMKVTLFGCYFIYFRSRNLEL